MAHVHSANLGGDEITMLTAIGIGNFKAFEGYRGQTFWATAPFNLTEYVLLSTRESLPGGIELNILVEGFRS